jgi:hypothetical protein
VSSDMLLNHSGLQCAEVGTVRPILTLSTVDILGQVILHCVSRPGHCRESDRILVSLY